MAIQFGLKNIVQCFLKIVMIQFENNINFIRFYQFSSVGNEQLKVLLDFIELL